MEIIIYSLLKGASLGLIIAIPSVGQAVLSIQETLSRGIKYGLISGLGVAVADTLFALAAGFGIHTLRDWIQSYQNILHISGAFFILLFGLALFVTKPEIQTDATPSVYSQWKVINAFMPNFLLTTLHPVTLIFFSAAFAALPLTDPSANILTISLVGLGVFLGSMIWWFALGWSVAHFTRDKMTTEWLSKIKKIFAVIMVLLGSWLLIKHLLLI